jgi:uncharacterized protein
MPAFRDQEWETMTLPQSIERAGLDMDGVVWFRKEVEVSGATASRSGTLSLGPIDDSDETWINGVKVGATKNQYSKPRTYTIPAGTLKAGKNIIAIRMEDTGNRGGLYGKPEEMFVLAGGKKAALAGDWKYDIEKKFTADQTLLFKDASIAELFVSTYMHRQPAPSSAAVDAGEVAPARKGATVIRIKSIQNEMKFDLKNFTVEAGKTVEIIFENPDFMQHNLVITKPGTMETVGRAADKLASDPRGAEMQYVPDIPEVLFHTRLVNPQETVRLAFTAPATPGDYPYVCTFPGHWSIMNGVMKVTKSNTAL